MGYRSWELYAKSTLKAQRTVELLVHASRTSVAKYPEFDKQFYKYPSYLRRSTISEALGAVSSYRAAVSHWESAGRKGKEPKLQTSRSAMPTFYKDNMYEDNGDGTARLKLYHKNDWVWVKVRLRKQDTDYIREHWDKADASAPKLVKRNRRYALCFAFEETVAYGTRPFLLLTLALTPTLCAALCVQTELSSHGSSSTSRVKKTG